MSMIAASIAIMMFQALLIASGSIVGKLAVLESSFNSSVITGLQECMKFLISIVFVKLILPYYSDKQPHEAIQQEEEAVVISKHHDKAAFDDDNNNHNNHAVRKRNNVPCWKYTLPALLYSTSNAAMFSVLVYITPAEFVLLWNTKIIFTAILHRFILKRYLSRLRVVALGVLLVGIVIAEYTIQMDVELKQLADILNTTNSTSADNNVTAGQGSVDDGSESDVAVVSLKLLAALATVFFALVVSFANVFTELIYKQNQQSVWEQNMMLYGSGILCNVVTVTLQQMTMRNGVEGSNGTVEDIWRGLNWWCFVMVLLGSCSGIITGLILKYIDVLFVVVADAMAVVLNIVISALLFGLHVTIMLVLGASMIVVAIILYHLRVKKEDGGGSGGSKRKEGQEAVACDSWDDDNVPTFEEDEFDLGSGSSVDNAEENDVLIKTALR